MNALEMPKRQHYLKFQATIPGGGRNQAQRRQKVIDTATQHLRAVAGALATNVEIRAVWQERGDKTDIMEKWDIMVVIGFDGHLTEEAKKLSIERKVFELDKQFDSPSKRVLLS